MKNVQDRIEVLQNGRDMKGLCAGFKLEHGTMETRYAVLADGTVLCGNATDAFGPHRNDFDFRGQSWSKAEGVPDEAEYIGWYKTPWMT